MWAVFRNSPVQTYRMILTTFMKYNSDRAVHHVNTGMDFSIFTGVQYHHSFRLFLSTSKDLLYPQTSCIPLNPPTSHTWVWVYCLGTPLLSACPHLLILDISYTVSPPYQRDPTSADASMRSYSQ